MACRAEPDLVAVYESRNGALALLLRHTILPLPEERRQSTRRAAAAIIGRLRDANLEGRFVVLQWLPLDEVARVLRHWTCRYEGDAERRAQIARVVDGHLSLLTTGGPRSRSWPPRFPRRRPRRKFSRRSHRSLMWSRYAARARVDE